MIDFRHISLKHPRNSGNVGKFWYLKYLSCGVHLRNTIRIFLATPTKDADIDTTNQNIEKAWHTFVNWCLVNETVQPFCSWCSIRYPMNSIEEPSVVSRLTGSWHFLKRKSLKLYFYRNLQLLSFLLINIVCLDFCETSARTNFSRRIPAKVGSNFKYFLDIFSTHFLCTTPLLCLKVFLLILWQTCLIKEGMYVLKTNSEKRFLWHTLHVWLKNVKTDQGYQFPYHGVQGTHKIQLLTYSCNVQRTVEVKLPLKSKRESEKKRNESSAIDI